MPGRSAAEDELWNQEVTCWDFLKSGTLRSHLSLLHNDISAWPHHAFAPVNKEGIFQYLLPRIAAFQSPGVLLELTPLAVRVLGNVGIVQYHVHIKATPGVDQRLRVSRTWLRSDGGWKLIAGMSAPVTESGTSR